MTPFLFMEEMNHMKCYAFRWHTPWKKLVEPHHVIHFDATQIVELTKSMTQLNMGFHLVVFQRFLDVVFFEGRFEKKIYRTDQFWFPACDVTKIHLPNFELHSFLLT